MYAAEASGASRLWSANTFAAGMAHVHQDCKLELEQFDNDDALEARMKEFDVLFPLIFQIDVQDMQRQFQELEGGTPACDVDRLVGVNSKAPVRTHQQRCPRRTHFGTS